MRPVGALGMMTLAIAKVSCWVFFVQEIFHLSGRIRPRLRHLGRGESRDIFQVKDFHISFQAKDVFVGFLYERIFA